MAEVIRRPEIFNGGHKIRPKANPYIVTVTSGKGGVGKTTIATNLAYNLSKRNLKVLLVDADAGLGNVDVLLGLTPKFSLSHFFLDEKSLRDLIIKGPSDISVIPASSGVQELSELTEEQMKKFLGELGKLIGEFDVVILDTAPGIPTNVTEFCVFADEVIVVVTPDPMSITDAYALIKVLVLKYGQKHCHILVNRVEVSKIGENVYGQLSLVVDRFLDTKTSYLGHVLIDEQLVRAAKNQVIISEFYPGSVASSDFRKLSSKIFSLKSNNQRKVV
jgi:flagellar biosynthesis protein FlhG